MQTIHPCLWFNTQAEEAAHLYTSVFQNSKIGKIARYSAAGAQASGQKEGSVMIVEFELDGHKIIGLNGGPHFKFTPAFSLFVWRDSENEIDRLWEAISHGGDIRMGLDKYPWAARYGWTADRYGVEWQFMLSDKQEIAPAFLFVDKLFGKGEEAIRFYMSVFKNSKTEFMARDETTNTIVHGVFSLDGTSFALMEGKGEHHFTFSPAFSLVVTCQTQEEIDHYWTKLSHDPAAEQCGWLKDKYGVSWQIVPSILSDLMTDPKSRERVMKVLLQMKKLEIEKLKQA